ncbi:putative transcription factor AP2-EREBP family [Helianthus annuus]|nr:putative transcription factor AP2-EREBP family [Helianthus annuus]
MLTSGMVWYIYEPPIPITPQTNLIQYNNPRMVKASTTTSASTCGAAKYTGVRKRKWGKWVSEIRLPKSRERIWLGSYDTPEKAARAFDAALFCLRGNTANFNFPHQPPHIPGGRSLPPSQIQAAAANYANHPHQDSSSSSCCHSPVVSTDQGDTCTSPDFTGYMNLLDFGIYPGFDDYFVTTTPPITEEEDQDICDGIYSQDPSFLWNF